MKKLLLLFLVLVTYSCSLDLNNFEDRQAVLQDVKKLILYEELVARAYENLLIKNLELPTTSEIEVVTDDATTTIKTLIKNSIYNALSVDSSTTKFSYNLKTGDLVGSEEEIANIKNFYEDNSFRKNTYIQDNSVYFILEDDFAKHIFDLINQGKDIKKGCKIGQSCIQNDKDKLFFNHIYIDVDPDADFQDDVPEKYLIAYHIDNFKTGPIIITSNRSKQTSEKIFQSIPKGALMYDFDGVKYVKTSDSIEILK